MSPWFEPLLRPLLRRKPDSIAKQARRFRIDHDRGRELVSRLGGAFIGGYNAMLDADLPSDIATAGGRVETHFRPFFYEGAAMGILARGMISRRHGKSEAEARMLDLDPAFRYLYYVGFGFWYGIRYGRNPRRLLDLEAHVDPLYFPLCFDGLGFKFGFFDHVREKPFAKFLGRIPAEHFAWVCQGFGRALFFVYMDDEPAFERLLEAHPAHRLDIEQGRSLAVGFTGVNRPDGLIDYLDRSTDPERRAARLLGITWALSARRMNDRNYFEQCLRRAAPAHRSLLEALPDLCDASRDQAGSYREWQQLTRTKAMRLYPG